jgi:hypothetical protein
VLGLFLQRLGTWLALRGMDSMSGTVGFEELEEGGKKVSGVGWSYVSQLLMFGSRKQWSWRLYLGW